MKKKLLVSLFILIASLFISHTAFAASGWEHQEGSWYYREEGTLVTGWHKETTGTYYLGEDGVMKTGWQTIAGKRYFFRQDGIMHTGWWQDGGSWYYFLLDGTLLMDSIAPDGHKINPDGTWNAAELTVGAAGILNQAYGPYMINWATDGTAALADDDMVDMKVVSALLGRVDSAVLNAKEKEVYSLVKNFLENTLAPDDSDYEKVVKITRYIWRRGSENSSQGDSPYQLLVAGGGSLTAYARTFKLMANSAGLECYYVYSNRVVDNDSDLSGRSLGLESLLGELSGYYPWNIVKVEGDWYNAAITEIGNGASASYVLRCDREFPNYIYKEGDSPDCTATTYTKSKS